jgi:quaternary ammonium compound-resistance protein SugE
MAWAMLLVAGLLEVAWASGLKKTEGFTRVWPTIWTLATMAASFILLSRAMITLPTGVSYAVWVGIGAVGTAIVSWSLLGERLSLAQWACIGLIAMGIAGLKLTAGSSATA